MCVSYYEYAKLNVKIEWKLSSKILIFYALDLKPFEVKGDVEPAVTIFHFILAYKICIIQMSSANERGAERRIFCDSAMLCRTQMPWLRDGRKHRYRGQRQCTGT